MFDTLALNLTSVEVEGVNFIEVVPPYLSITGFHRYRYEQDVITGDLNGLRVSITPHNVRITAGSLCKWYLGDNLQTMGRRDTQQAIERLSDALHVPFQRANVTRLDVGTNIITRYPCDVYFHYLGTLSHYQRLEQMHGIYYQQDSKKAVFYDKLNELRTRREEAPELYQGRNVLRYELRYTRHIPRAMNVEKLTASMLYDEEFYTSILKRWVSIYRDIHKINDVNFNFEAMKGKKELYDLGVCALVEKMGGEAAMMDKILEGRARGLYSPKQVHDLKEAVKSALGKRYDLAGKNDVISELNKKVTEAVAYYR